MRERVYVTENWQADRFDIFIFPPPPPGAEFGGDEGQMWRVRGDGGLALDAVGEHDQWTGRPAPTVSLPAGVLAEVVRQFLKQRPTEGADDAIRDARETRDRLLTLVEEALRNRLGYSAATVGMGG